MQTTTIGAKLRRGMSLLELLTAMTITAVLAGFLLGGAQKVIVLAANLQIAWEISQLNDAVEDFAVQFGDYPPDFHDQAKVVRFLQIHFPRCPAEHYPDFAGQSPASALFFWLAGPQGKGFCADPTNPFGNGPRRIGPFIRFADDRLKKNGTVVQYLPPQNKGGSPYVYFRAGEKGYEGNSGWPPARPYRDSRDGSWINADSFQILCAGHDGVYGAGNHFPGGADYDPFNMDDLANFSHGGTMKQAIPRAGQQPTAAPPAAKPSASKQPAAQKQAEQSPPQQPPPEPPQTEQQQTEPQTAQQ